jgi:hypothetical protein
MKTAVLCGIALSLAAHADTLFDNLNNIPGTVLGTFPIGADGPEGDSFSTGSSPFMVTQVALKLQGVQDGESFNISLYSDNATSCTSVPVCTGGPLAPLYSIVTMDDDSLSTTLTNYVFVLGTPQTLAANTRYWIIASSANNSQTLWSYTEDLSGTGITGEFNTDIGGPLPNADLPGCLTGPNNSNSCTPFQLQVTGSAVPEPGTFALLGLAILSIAARTRKNPRLL